MRRWLVERFFAWIQWQRRVLIRWEYHAHNFFGFVQLACLIILFTILRLGSSQRPHVACELPQPPPRGDHLSGVPAMLVVAVARPLGPPDPSAPPCIRQRILPVTADDRHGVPEPLSCFKRACGAVWRPYLFDCLPESEPESCWMLDGC
jgi:hypothetical protein